MDLKKHGYWVAMGVLGAIAGVLYIVLVVLGVNAEVAKKKRTLDDTLKDMKRFAGKTDEEAADPLKGMPVPELVKYWKDRKNVLGEDAKKIEELYRHRAEAFRRHPQEPLATFVSGLRQQVENELAKPYKAYFETDVAKALPITEPTPQKDEEIPFAQKKFYIGKSLLEAAKDAHVKTVVEVKFKEPDKPDAKAPPRDIERIEVDVTLKMPAPGVPQLVAHLLHAQVVTFEVSEISIEPVPFSYPELEPWKVFEMAQTPQGAPVAGALWKSFPRDVFIGVQKASDPKAKTRPAEIDQLPEPVVQVHLLLHALDFNFPEKPKS